MWVFFALIPLFLKVFLISAYPYQDEYSKTNHLSQLSLSIPCEIGH